ncbi:MAG: hypothetical protein DIU68_004875 [Chloroflexota bacterium]|nr:MAG: hypothetical protein DIU68_18990 [Chloroflexota bacterium]
MSQKRRSSDQVFMGVFLIGLAVLFLSSYWWPGIMFVIGLAMIARTVSEGREWNSDRNALIVLGIGVLFAAWDFVGGALRIDMDVMLPLALIVVGLYLLFRDRLRSRL